MSETIAEFGCEVCCAPSAEAVWHDRATVFAHGTDVVDDSHFMVSTRRCRTCGQHFASIFTEFIDWKNGDDAQYLTLLPVTPPEADALAAGTLTPFRLGTLGAGRRYLNHDRPSGGPSRVYWRTGPFMVVEGH